MTARSSAGDETSKSSRSEACDSETSAPSETTSPARRASTASKTRRCSDSACADALGVAGFDLGPALRVATIRELAARSRVDDDEPDARPGSGRARTAPVAQSRSIACPALAFEDRRLVHDPATAHPWRADLGLLQDGRRHLGAVRVSANASPAVRARPTTTARHRRVSRGDLAATPVHVIAVLHGAPARHSARSASRRRSRDRKSASAAGPSTVTPQLAGRRRRAEPYRRDSRCAPR